MKKIISKKIEIPAGVSCQFENGILTCQKDSVKLEKRITNNKIHVDLKDNELSIVVQKGNKKDYANALAFVAHVKNMIKRLTEQAQYEMEICNVHFPMTVKVEGNKFVINNFLGEKEKRRAEIIEGVKVEVNGNKLKITSNDLEKAGQTAANIEKATKVKKRDRRVFQDGIFLISKNGEAI